MCEENKDICLQACNLPVLITRRDQLPYHLISNLLWIKLGWNWKHSPFTVATFYHRYMCLYWMSFCHLEFAHTDEAFPACDTEVAPHPHASPHTPWTCESVFQTHERKFATKRLANYNVTPAFWFPSCHVSFVNVGFWFQKWGNTNFVFQFLPFRLDRNFSKVSTIVDTRKYRNYIFCVVKLFWIYLWRFLMNTEWFWTHLLESAGLQWVGCMSSFYLDEEDARRPNTSPHLPAHNRPNTWQHIKPVFFLSETCCRQRIWRKNILVSLNFISSMKRMLWQVVDAVFQSSWLNGSICFCVWSNMKKKRGNEPFFPGLRWNQLRPFRTCIIQAKKQVIWDVHVEATHSQVSCKITFKTNVRLQQGPSWLAPCLPKSSRKLHLESWVTCLFPATPSFCLVVVGNRDYTVTKSKWSFLSPGGEVRPSATKQGGMD